MPDVSIARNGALAYVTLSNPGKLNAIDSAMWHSLAQTLNALSQDASLRCVIVYGNGGHFAAGADVEEFARGRNTVAQGSACHTRTIANALNAISECMHLTIAAIDGMCTGGGMEVACACNIRIASLGSRFSIPVNRLGFPLAPGELHHLLQLGRQSDRTGNFTRGPHVRRRRSQRKMPDSPYFRGSRNRGSGIAYCTGRAARMNKQLARRMSAVPEPLTEQELHSAFAFLNPHDYRWAIQPFSINALPISLANKITLQ